VRQVKAQELGGLIVGMKTERKWMELSSAIFVFIFFSETETDIEPPENKYENRY
jgi:hypothetical protein